MYRLAAAMVLASAAWAQTAAETEIAAAAHSPYDFAKYVGSHPDLDWPALWRAMGDSGPLPEYLPQCENPEDCRIELIPVAVPSQVIVVVNPLSHFYFRFLRQGSGWRFAGYYRPDYVIADHALAKLGAKPILKITEAPRGGTGLSMTIESWFDLSLPDFQPVFTFTVEGNEDYSIAYLGRGVTAAATSSARDGSEIVNLTVTVDLFFGGESVGMRQMTGTYTRAGGQKSFTLQSATVEGKAMPLEDFKLISDIPEGRPTEDRMLVYAFDGLKRLASGKDGEVKTWMKAMLDRCGDSAEKRTLLELLALP